MLTELDREYLQQLGRLADEAYYRGDFTKAKSLRATMDSKRNDFMAENARLRREGAL